MTGYKLVTIPTGGLHAVASLRGAGPAADALPRVDASGVAPAKPNVSALLRGAGIFLSASADVTALQAGADKGAMTVAEADKLLAGLSAYGRPLSGVQRMAAKSALARAGLLK